MSMRTGSTMHFEPGSWQEAVHDIYIGMLTGCGHVVYFFKKFTIDLFLIQPYYYLTGQQETYELPDAGELKVVGIGFGRTGTYSLTLALEQLGFPTIHTQHLYEHEEIFRMWTDLIFNPSLENGHAELGHPDFNVITKNGYKATMDFPTALYYEQILEQYPSCKFILTTRENSQVWFRSWDTLTKSITAPANLAGTFIAGVRRYSIYLRWLFAVVNKDDSFLTSARPKNDQYKDAAIESYETHNRRVKEVIPKSQILEYSVKDGGWGPLCTFLEITPSDCPTTPFPKTNSARSVQVQSVASMVVPLIVVLITLFYLFTKVFQRMTGRTVIQWVNLQTTLLPLFLSKTMIEKKHHQDQGQPEKQQQQQLPQKSSSNPIFGWYTASKNHFYKEN